MAVADVLRHVTDPHVDENCLTTRRIEFSSKPLDRPIQVSRDRTESTFTLSRHSRVTLRVIVDRGGSFYRFAAGVSFLNESLSRRRRNIGNRRQRRLKDRRWSRIFFAIFATIQRLLRDDRRRGGNFRRCSVPRFSVEPRKNISRDINDRANAGYGEILAGNNGFHRKSSCSPGIDSAPMSSR